MRFLISTLACAVLITSSVWAQVTVTTPPRVIVTPPVQSAPQQVNSPTPVARTWVLTGLEAAERGSACVWVTNLGSRTARVQARAVSYNGRTDRDVDAWLNRGFGEIGRGRQAYGCVGLGGHTVPSDMRQLWFVVSASEPVAVRGLYAYDQDMGGDIGTQGPRVTSDVTAMPIDCTNPAGVEYACQIAAGAVGVTSVVVSPR